MSGAPTNRKLQLTITRVKMSDDGVVSLDTSVTFKAMLNPSEFKHRRAICYNTRMTLGQVASQTRFKGVQPDTVTFSILLDGTGAVPLGPGERFKEVIQHVDALERVVYDYESQKHEPGRVNIVWGTLILFGRMQSMSIGYSLFKPNGDPLRAKVDLEFVGYMSSKEEALIANPSSPDLSHLVVVNEGDTLPLLCDRYYGDPGYYREVAAFNGLDTIARLKPGTRLHFPPLV